MSLVHDNPKITELRRSKKVLERQIRSRTAEFEKSTESLSSEIACLKRTEQELKAQIADRAAAFTKINEALLAEAGSRERAEKAACDAEERCRTMIDALPLLVWQSGTDKLCTYFNKCWLEFTGRTMEQELGDGWTENVHPDDFQRCLGIYTNAFDRRESFVIEYRLRYRSGEYRWILDRGGPQYSSEGTFLGYIGGCIDAHERKLAETELQKSREELRTLATRLRANREYEKKQLARDIHDELNGTLSALKMDLSLLPDRAATDRHSFLEKLDSMSELIDRTVSRVRAIVTELRPVVLDKVGLIAAVEWQTREFQNHSKIVCETHLPLEEIPLDPERSTAVFRILQEALTNVRRHANASKVVVDFGTEPGYIILSVRDDGGSIDERIVFADTSIGLLGMRERALSFGGTVDVTPLQQGGTLVRLRMPSQQSE
jgi:PAS domain S-box-containing protein